MGPLQMPLKAADDHKGAHYGYQLQLPIITNGPLQLPIKAAYDLEWAHYGCQ
jgi:hypothetical protein